MSKKLHLFKQLNDIYVALLENNDTEMILNLLKDIDLEKVVRYYINTDNQKM